MRHENLLNTSSCCRSSSRTGSCIAPDAALAEGAEALAPVRDAGDFSGWIVYTHSRVRDRVDGEWLHRSWDQRDYASGGLALARRALGSLARDDLAPRLADDRGRNSRRSSRFPLVEVGKRNAENVVELLRASTPASRAASTSARPAS